MGEMNDAEFLGVFGTDPAVKEMRAHIASLEARLRVAEEERDGANEDYAVLVGTLKLANDSTARALTQSEIYREAIIEARRELWWFVERDTGEGWGFENSDVDEIAMRAMNIQDKVLAKALATASGEGEAGEP